MVQASLLLYTHKRQCFWCNFPWFTVDSKIQHPIIRISFEGSHTQIHSQQWYTAFIFLRRRNSIHTYRYPAALRKLSRSSQLFSSPVRTYTYAFFSLLQPLWLTGAYNLGHTEGVLSLRPATFPLGHLPSNCPKQQQREHACVRAVYIYANEPPAAPPTSIFTRKRGKTKGKKMPSETFRIHATNTTVVVLCTPHHRSRVTDSSSAETSKTRKTIHTII